ncbi:gastrula zinc finger protein XlCGF26.1-like [Chelmon rostratus]|uniref:gastrula zinc finger protein XlCGF26.1-like n=1 Tax=Chelmon rostratus TaxID=109905 RepID=UPI001BEA5A8C|nr:gastrula zinc finger protein XlCGF26.1-like [Chelmon rostratus]
MSKVQTLRAFVKQRLTAAAEEIFEQFERTIAEYEEEVCRQQKLLDAVFKPEVRLHRADVQLLLGRKEEDPPEQQDWRSSLDQEDPAEPPQNNEEQEELWTSQEGEQLGGLEEADITKFTFPPVPVKSEEEDEEEPQSSQLHQRQTEQMKTESDGEDCGGPEPTRNLDPDTHLQPQTDDRTADFSKLKKKVSDDWKKCSEPESGLNCLKSNSECHSARKSFSCLVCGKRFSQKSNLQNHMRIHTGEKPFSCVVCSKRFIQKVHLLRHMALHTGEKRDRCSDRGKRLTRQSQLKTHQCAGLQSSQFHQSQTEESRDAEHVNRKAEGEDCGGPEPDKNSDPDRHLQPDTHDKTSHSSESETDDSCDWEETREPQSGLNPLQNNEVPVSDVKCKTGKTSVSSSGCTSSSDHKGRLQRRSGNQTGEKPLSCSVCGKNTNGRNL